MSLVEADMTWKVGDRGPVWQLNLGDQQPEEAWSLTGTNPVIFYWDAVTGESIGSAALTIISSPSAIVEFDPDTLPAVTAVERDLFAEVYVDFGTGPETFPNDRHLLVHVHHSP